MVYISVVTKRRNRRKQVRLKERTFNGLVFKSGNRTTKKTGESKRDGTVKGSQLLDEKGL